LTSHKSVTWENGGVAFEDDLADAERRARGAVFHHHSSRAGKTKFLVVLNHAWPPDDGLAVYAFTTTNVGHFADAHIPEEVIVRLNPGDYPFVTAPTVIDLTRPELEQLSAIVQAPSFKFVTQLRREHVSSIDEAVRASTLIVRKVKKMILVSYG
jgi:hypothetical protein